MSKNALLPSILLLSLCSVLPARADVVTVTKENSGWQLKINGVPHLVKGVVYTPAQRGHDPNNATLPDWMIHDGNMNGTLDFPYESFVDANFNNVKDSTETAVGDFQLMREMGVNTIRVYHHASSAAAVQAGYGGNPSQLLQYNHAPNKELLRDLYNNYGIRVAMGDLIGAYTVGAGVAFSSGTNYLDPVQKMRLRASVEQMVLDFKDEPYILMWVLGNENNYSFTATNAGTQQVAYAQFVEEMVQLIKSMDPNHPVALSMGDITFNLNTLKLHAPSIDIYGCNAYRGGNFGNIWTQVRNVLDKPVMFTEYGDYQNGFPDNLFDEERQVHIHAASWNNIIDNTAGGLGTDNAIGGFAMEFVDNWWQNGLPFAHNKGTGGSHLEWQGLLSQGNGVHSPFIRQKRLVYGTYQALWIVPSILSGDYDSDCDVDGHDFLLWQRQFGGVVPYYQGADGNGSGTIDAADYVLWRDNYGSVCPAPVTAPPPASLIADDSFRVVRAKFYPTRGEIGDVAFTLGQPTHVKIVLYDRRGYEVKTLTNDALSAGNHTAVWDGRDNSGALAAPGVYTGVFNRDGQPSKFKLIVIR